MSIDRLTTDAPLARAGAAPARAEREVAMENGAHRLWGGRFAAPPADAFDALNRSIGIDLRLWPFDLQASKAWAIALWEGGVVSLAESRRLVEGLDAVGRRLAAGERPIASDEDVHTAIDRMLHDEVGDLASRLHTGRSRNDQVATATRLWAIDACGRLNEGVRALERTLLARAESLGDALMPSYTHLQRAQPVAAAHWLLAHFWPLERDRGRLAAAAHGASSLPLGAGAVSGCAYPVSRLCLRGTLGFDRLAPNSIDAVGDRDFVAELLFAIATLGVHLSRLAEELILFGTSEFGFVRFGDGFSSGSSMMPQKRNPDALELARAAGARTIGDLTTLLALLKGLPGGYNKDLQDDKRILFGAVDATLLVLAAVTGCVDELTFRTDRMAAALSSEMLATDLADHLVRRGITFRDAHAAVGRLVREAEDRAVALHELPLSSFTAAHPAFDMEVFGALSMREAVGRREVEGGTGPGAVRAQLAEARQAVAARPWASALGACATAGIPFHE